MLLTINCPSRNSAKMTANTLIDEGIAFEFSYYGGISPCAIEIYDPTDEGLQFLMENFKITAVHKERHQPHIPTDPNQINLLGK